jgi:hypothetical protein
MAITFQKQPLNFFNVNEPAIFEFSSNEDLGVNINDVVADLEIKSLWTGRRYVIKNIQPNYNNGVFRIDVSGYLKALMLDNFDYSFDSDNKKYGIENFSIGVSVHPENGGNGFNQAYTFDSGYIFDETFIFADVVPNDNEVNNGFYPTLGITHISENVKTIKDLTKLNILAPKYIEFAKGFNQTLSVFVGDLATTPKQIIVDGVTSVLPATKGISTGVISDQQVSKMMLPTLIATSLNNPLLKVYGIAYKEDYCENTLQFRFYTSYAGYSYFYTPKESLTATRSKSEFINNDFYNQQDGKSSQIQRSVDYSESLNLSGVKPLELEELFRELLRSPKIEILLPIGYRECKISGSQNVRKLDFEYSLIVDIANASQMGL